MTRLAARAAVAGLCLLAAACAAPPETRDVQAPRIVSLNPCADAILAEIAPDHLLALSHYSHDPRSSSMDLAAARRFRAVSGSAEEIAALRPDLVVASQFLPPATEQALAGMGLEVVKVRSIASLDDAREQVRDLAALSGASARGEAMVAKIDAAVAAAAPPDAARPRALVWQGGGLVPGDKTLIADLLHAAGFAHHSAVRGLGQGAILPLERVMADAPHVIIAAGSPEMRENRLLHHPALGGLGHTRRADLPPRLLWCGGPTIPETLARLAQIRREAVR